MKNNVTIKCPNCGMEYLPAEIFVPDAFFGKPEVIKRDTEGHIIDYIGKSLDTEDFFTCDKCEATFNIKTDISFDTYIVEENNFAQEVTEQSRAKFKVESF